MRTPSLQKPEDLNVPEDANDILQEWNRRHHLAGLYMSIPLVGGVLLATMCSSPVSDIAMSIASALGLTVGVSVIPDSFRSRRGSLKPALCLIAVMWLMALLVTIIQLFG